MENNSTYNPDLVGDLFWGIFKHQWMSVSAQAAFSSADLGADSFNAVLVGQITHYLTAEQNKNLFQRIYATLKSNGVLVINCPMTTDK